MVGHSLPQPPTKKGKKDTQIFLDQQNIFRKLNDIGNGAHYIYLFIKLK